MVAADTEAAEAEAVVEGDLAAEDDVAAVGAAAVVDTGEGAEAAADTMISKNVISITHRAITPCKNSVPCSTQWTVPATDSTSA